MQKKSQADENTPLSAAERTLDKAGHAAESKDGPPTDGTDVKQTAFNMINCFIGAGILTVPFAFKLAGYGAVFGLTLVAALNWYTSVLLGKALEKSAALRPEVPHGAWDMPELGFTAFGPSGSRAISVLFALELWFALETFIVLTGINVHLLTGIPTTAVIVAAGLIGTASLSLPMSVIAGFSFLSVWCMIGGLLALVVCGHGVSTAGGEPVEHTLVDIWSMPSAIGIFLYCFSGLPCLPNIRAAMRRPEQYGVAVHCAFSFAFVYYGAIGLLGYFYFANGTKQSFSQNLFPTPGQQHYTFYHAFALLSAGLFAAKLQAGFPLYAAPVLGTFGCSSGAGDERFVWGGRMLFAFVSIAFAVFAQHELDAVAELMGAFLTNFTSIIFPCAAYAGVCRARGERLGTGHAIAVVTLLILGVSFAVIGTFSACRRFLLEERGTLAY
eukprot:gnl/TRDRNA2_/TRDRNA2_85630_c0_seq1.p1 gnl/TRDRNA2_/TRDRNA2_85630_c0~~gnl/TRDRNA2_/TRDRNA2_85630_c0_seq1.p1  ORF type:complete len:441 (-),score=71.20 gnl/TRDRNA2_/TRDRNA2_85630_c0_seq1:96-1418(-)